MKGLRVVWCKGELTVAEGPRARKAKGCEWSLCGSDRDNGKGEKLLEKAREVPFAQSLRAWRTSSRTRSPVADADADRNARSLECHFNHHPI